MQSIEKKILTTIGVFAGVSVVIIGGIIVPTLGRIKQLDNDTYNLRLTLERKNEQVTGYRMAIKQIEKIKKEMPDFTSHLFLTGQELKLITTLESLAANEGVTQKVINSNLDSITNQQIQISLSVSGPYAKTMSYLKDLEELPYFINISRLSLAPAVSRSTEPATNDVNMNLDISLYVIP